MNLAMGMTSVERHCSVQLIYSCIVSSIVLCIVPFQKQTIALTALVTMKARAQTELMPSYVPVPMVMKETHVRQVNIIMYRKWLWGQHSALIH